MLLKHQLDINYGHSSRIQDAFTTQSVLEDTANYNFVDI